MKICIYKFQNFYVYFLYLYYLNKKGNFFPYSVVVTAVFLRFVLGGGGFVFVLPFFSWGGWGGGFFLVSLSGL